MAPPGQGPLAGLRVVEMAGIGPAPFAAMMLADMGADVLRIAGPGRQGRAGDPTLRGRASLRLDLKDPAQVEAAAALAARADALVEGFRPGVMERLGLGPAPLLAANPRLVYARMTGWGQDGPWAARAGHDINYIALTGALAAIGPGDGPPCPPLNLVGDYGGGALYLVAGVLAALLSARSTGRGQVVDCAMVDGVASLMTVFTHGAAEGRWHPTRQSNMLDGAAPYYGTYECADGGYVAVGCIEPQFWAIFLERLGLEGPVWATRDDPAAWPGLRARLAGVFRTRSRDAWAALFEGTDACVAPVLTMVEAADHPHMAARGSMEGPAPAPRFAETPSRPRPASTIELDAALSAWGR